MLLVFLLGCLLELDTLEKGLEAFNSPLVLPTFLSYVNFVR